MALELVGGALLSASLQTLFERLSSAEVLDYLRGKSKRSCDFVELVGKLKLVLNSMTAVLDDAELKQMRKKPGVDAWLEELQDAVYDADDILDEIEYDALRLKVEPAESRASTSKVRNLFKKKKKLRNFFSASNSSNVGDMESKMKKILERLEYIAKQKDVLDLKEVTLREKPSWRLPSTSLVDESEVYGRDDDKDVLIKLLLSDEICGKEICVIPIVGMGGVGKTTLAQSLFNNDEVEKHYQLKAWVCVSEEFDVCKVTKTILEAVTSYACAVTDLNLLQVKLKEWLTGNKFLIVLDDVWNENYDDWNLMKMPFKDGAQGSKIIVTTRSKNVASIMRTVPSHHLKELTDEACWQLFATHAAGGGDFVENPVLERIGREIVAKCKGLPLAAKTLGGLLRSRLDVEEWERILKSDIWDLTDRESNILPALRLSYHYLPSHLKRCFAYCSIFPKDYNFEKKELVYLWMTENLLENPKGKKGLEEVGNEYFNDLVSRSFFQHSSVFGESYFVMHDLMVDMAKFVSGKYCFLIEKGKPNEIALIKQARHITFFMKDHDAHEILKLACEAPYLRTFLPLKFGLLMPSFNYEEILLRDLFKLRCLRYLSLSGYSSVKQLTESIGELRHLRYLDLSDTSIKMLPESLSRLYNLQTLKLSRCYRLTTLPKDLNHLINLRCLDVKDSGIVEMPAQISKLKSLQALSAFIVGKDNGAKIGELGELSDLRGRLSIYHLQNVVKENDDVWGAKLRDKKHLEELELKWSDNTNISEHERDVLDNLLPNTSLKELRIEKYGGTSFPTWLGDPLFCNLVDLSLTSCKFCHTLPPLGQLPSLKTLLIREFDAVVTVGPEFYGKSSLVVKPFASLESLSFFTMSNWKEWSIPIEDVETFPKLRELHISDCERLNGDLPSYLPSLTDLTIRGCPQLASPLPKMPIVVDISLSNCKRLAECQVVKSFSCLEYLEIFNSFDPITLRSLPASLKSLRISHCNKLEFPVHTHESLQELSMKDCNCSSIQLFPLNSFPNIRDLKIEDCQNLGCFSLCQSLKSLTSLLIGGCPNFTLFPNSDLHCPILTQLTLENCKKLKVLPEQLQSLLPSLQYLSISNCPELESFPISGLPVSLHSLSIISCDKLIAGRKNWNLQALPNLTSFTIGEYRCEDTESFPEQGLLPTTIARLYIWALDCLKSLDKNGFQQLTSLQQLDIRDCPNLQTLPEVGLPTSLKSFSIDKCPVLEEKCEREKGEYWNKIARIPYIIINAKGVQTPSALKRSLPSGSKS